MRSTHQQIASRNDFAAVLATGIAFFMIVLDTSIVNLALPRIADTFHAGLITLQWLVDGYALVFASLLLGAGALGDRYSAKGVFVAGLIVFSIASAALHRRPAASHRASKASHARESRRASVPPCCCRIRGRRSTTP